MSRYLDKYANLPAWCPFHLLYLRPPSSLGSRRSIAFSLALPLLHPSLIFFSLFFVLPLFFSPHFLCKLGVSRNYCNALSSLESNPIRRLFSYLCVVRDLFRRKRWWCKGSFWSTIYKIYHRMSNLNQSKTIDQSHRDDCPKIAPYIWYLVHVQRTSCVTPVHRG